MPPVDFHALFETWPDPYLLMDRDLTIVSANSAYLTVTGRRLEDIVGQKGADVFPSPPDPSGRQQVRDSLERTVNQNVVDHLPLVRYDLERAGENHELYWSVTHTPLLGPGGACAYVLQHAVEATELHRLRMRVGETPEQGDAVEAEVSKRTEALQALNERLGVEIERLKLLFEQAPGFMAVLWGPQHVFTMANMAYEQVVGGRDVIGKSVAEALPEIVEQGFIDLLDTVLREGEAYLGQKIPVQLAVGRDPGGSGARFHLSADHRG